MGLECRGCDIADFVHKSFVHKIGNPHIARELTIFVLSRICLHINADTPFFAQRSCATNKKKTTIRKLPSGELAGARTQDPNIKSVVLYLLSYEFIAPNRFWWCKDRTFFSNAKIKCIFLSSRALIRKTRACSTRKIANITYK